MNLILALTAGEIWPMGFAAACIVYGAGALVERVRDTRYVRKDSCELKHDYLRENFDFMKAELKEIKSAVKGETKNAA